MADFSTAQVAAVAGASVRQVDAWVRAGLLRPVVAARGSGSRRRFDSTGVRLACVLAALARRGVPASRVRVGQLVAAGRQELAPGLSIVLDVEVFDRSVADRMKGLGG